jgi:hypothetical protein
MPRLRRLNLVGIPQQMVDKPDDYRCSSYRRGLSLGRESFKSQIKTQLEIKLGSGKAGRPPKTN